jgi:hypothetical protein
VAGAERAEDPVQGVGAETGPVAVEPVEDAQPVQQAQPVQTGGGRGEQGGADLVGGQHAVLAEQGDQAQVAVGEVPHDLEQVERWVVAGAVAMSAVGC